MFKSQEEMCDNCINEKCNKKNGKRPPYFFESVMESEHCFMNNRKYYICTDSKFKSDDISVLETLELKEEIERLKDIHKSDVKSVGIIINTCKKEIDEYIENIYMWYCQFKDQMNCMDKKFVKDTENILKKFKKI